MSFKACFISLVLLALAGCGAGDNPSVAGNADHGCQGPSGCLALGAEPVPRVLLSANPVEAETPFDIELQFDAPVSDLQVRIEGATMFMGYIPVQLTRTSDTGYRGSAMVGACTTDRMEWRLLMEWRAGGVVHQARVDFTVLK